MAQVRKLHKEVLSTSLVRERERVWTKNMICHFLFHYCSESNGKDHKVLEMCKLLFHKIHSLPYLLKILVKLQLLLASAVPPAPVFFLISFFG